VLPSFPPGLCGRLCLLGVCSLDFFPRVVLSRGPLFLSFGARFFFVLFFSPFTSLARVSVSLFPPAVHSPCDFCAGVASCTTDLLFLCPAGKDSRLLFRVAADHRRFFPCCFLKGNQLFSLPRSLLPRPWSTAWLTHFPVDLLLYPFSFCSVLSRLLPFLICSYPRSHPRPFFFFR